MSVCEIEKNPFCQRYRSMDMKWVFEVEEDCKAPHMREFSKGNDI
jgi:hypothetical protein